MEHSTSAVNWQPRNIAKRPGEMRRNSLTHLARGADAVLFFQIRAGQKRRREVPLRTASRRPGTTPASGREAVALGADIAALDALVGSRVHARVAIAWDWESFWAQDLDWRPSIDLNHRERIEAFYAALWHRGVTVDFVHPAADLSGYDVLFAPSLYLIDDASAENIRAFVTRGGTLAVSYFSGIVASNDDVPYGPYPGQLRDVLGLVDRGVPAAARRRNRHAQRRILRPGVERRHHPPRCRHQSAATPTASRPGGPRSPATRSGPAPRGTSPRR